MIITICNDLNIPKEVGGIRAIGTTLWWIALSIFLIMIAVRKGYEYQSEKLLGLLLLLLTVGKIVFYDLEMMDMDKKIVVLMVVGGGIMLFSYFLQKKGYFQTNAFESRDKDHDGQETKSLTSSNPRETQE